MISLRESPSMFENDKVLNICGCLSCFLLQSSLTPIILRYFHNSVKRQDKKKNSTQSLKKRNKLPSNQRQNYHNDIHSMFAQREIDARILAEDMWISNMYIKVI